MNKVYKTLGLISQLGISMIAPVILCTILGVYLDEKYSLSLTIPLIILGVLAGSRNVFALVRHIRVQITDEEEEE